MKNLTMKILTVGLTAVLFTGCLTACKTNTKGNVNMAVSSRIEQNEEGELKVGGWSVPASHVVTEEHKKIYKNACSKYDGTGSSHEPVALLATQVVNGTNYCFYCQSTDREFFYDNKGEVVPGGWENAADPSITEDIKKVLSKATETLAGESYEPVAYIASQVVAGKNHAILCKSSPSVKELNGATTYILVTIYEDLQGKCEITETKDIDLSFG